MPTPPCSRPLRRPRRPTPPIPSREGWPATLERLAAVLAGGVDHGTGAIVGVAAGPAGAVDLHLRPVDLGGLTAELVGWQAPSTWLAAGVVAAARVSRLRPGQRGVDADDDSRRGASHDPARIGADLLGGSGVAVLARPDGALVVGVGGTGPPRSWTTPPDRGEGRLADLCRRSVGAPTPPCPEPPRHAWAAPWLDAVVRMAAARPRRAGPLPWREIARAHPLVPTAHPGAAVPTPEELARLVDHPLGAASWEELRRATAAGRSRPGDIPAAEASWLDTGSFARRLLAAQPPPAELLAALADLLPPALHDRVVTVAAAWDVVVPGGAAAAGGPGATAEPSPAPRPDGER